MIYFWEGSENQLSRLPDQCMKAFALMLNPMRGRAEDQRMVAVSDNRDELKKFWRAELAEKPYTDLNWQKVYRAGGPLEWFNAPYPNEKDVDDYGNGIIELRRDSWRRVA